MSITLHTRRVTKPATGLPPREMRPGTWRPGTADDVRLAVVTAALHAATLSYFTNPSSAAWDRLTAAQASADSIR